MAVEAEAESAAATAVSLLVGLSAQPSQRREFDSAQLVDPQCCQAMFWRPNNLGG
jgi:hypothetical protein